MPTCINLRERFGKRYRITHDPAYYAEHGERGRAEDPWLQMIEGGAGHVYPWGGDTLAASTNRRGPLTLKLAAIEGAKLVQDGTDGATVTFPVDRFAEVARLLHLRTRRRLSPEHKAALAASNLAHRFRGLATVVENVASV